MHAAHSGNDQAGCCNGDKNAYVLLNGVNLASEISLRPFFPPDCIGVTGRGDAPLPGVTAQIFGASRSKSDASDRFPPNGPSCAKNGSAPQSSGQVLPFS